MCGIVGLVHRDGAPVSLELLRSMNDRMTHRGPDDAGYYIGTGIGLAMRRLSIVDVAGGHQPISNEDGSIQLVLNGEIYNHVELRTELQKRGHVFRTLSDAEVVIHLYEESGFDALESLNGMFAFALHDERNRVTWIARDRLGIKPLFYLDSGNTLAFSSDINALRKLASVTLDIAQAINFVTFSYVPGVDTIWSKIKRLPPAHFLSVRDGKFSSACYWRPDQGRSVKGSPGEAGEQLETILSDSVALELRSDVPLGVFLSGGIDSSAIVAIASEHLSSQLVTYTIEFEGKASKDGTFARMVADQYGTDHRVVRMGSVTAAEGMDELLPLLDEPVGDSAVIPAYWLSRAARADGIKVLLNGAGGDEIFGGYSRHLPGRVGSPAWLANRLPSPMRHLLSYALSPISPDRAFRIRDAAYGWVSAISGVGMDILRRLLRDPAHFSKVDQEVISQFYGADGVGSTGEFSTDRMLLDIRTYLPGDVLALTDKATMAASVEGRVPLLDHRLVEYALSLPASVNLPGGISKGLFREILRRRLPDELLNREKEGFNAPDDSWMQPGSALDPAMELLHNRTAFLDEIFDPGVLKELLNSADVRRRFGSMIFSIYMLNRWCKAHGIS